MNITKGITIQGETTTDTINRTANDQTIIVDNLPRVPGGQGFFHASTNSDVRITGITFSGQGGILTVMFNGALRFSGVTHRPVRVDHCHITHLAHSPAIGVWGNANGVADHNVADDYTGQFFFCQVFGEGWGTINGLNPANFGSSDFFFIENNWINGGPTFTQGAQGAVDSSWGGKVCFRHNSAKNMVTVGHGTGANTARGRGVRAFEIYENDLEYTNGGGLDGTTTGSMVVHDNRLTGTLVRGWGLQVYRQFWSYGAPFYGADGSQPWDVNDPQLYDSGMLTGANNGTFTITDTSKNWTPNQWAGYSVSRPGDHAMGMIRSNTSNTITYLAWQTMNWEAGNQYQIRKVITVLDQPGRGKGDLLSGNPPMPVGWPHQESEPCYSWNNVYTPTGAQLNFVRGAGNTIQEGRDFFNDTAIPGYMPFVYLHPLAANENQSPTPAPTPTAPATAMPTPTPTATARATATATPRHTPRPHPSHGPAKA